ncbi:MAG: cupin domain-containing protein [Pseudomonadota bacterium]
MTETTRPAAMMAEARLPTHDLAGDLAFFQGLGFRLDVIFPADDPAVAVISGFGLRIRLARGAVDPPGTIRLLAEDPAVVAGPARELTSPGGTRVEIARLNPPMEIPPTEHAFIVRRLADEEPWVIGRAGMAYRDLIPGRLGGSIIASHIRIPGGGPVPDMVHYHTVGFQLIYCYRGWVDLVYEDQGPPFRLEAGDCVIQPPEIRHRVLYASNGVEVIEIGVPAEHVTTIDHEMTLPNGPANADRVFQGQRFVHHKMAGATWAPWRLPGLEARDTGIGHGTAGVAAVQIARARAEATPWWRHTTDILLNFVLEGTMVLESRGQPKARLAPGEAFVIPPGLPVQYREMSADLELLEVALPGAVPTDLVD